MKVPRGPGAEHTVGQDDEIPCGRGCCPCLRGGRHADRRPRRQRSHRLAPRNGKIGHRAPAESASTGHGLLLPKRILKIVGVKQVAPIEARMAAGKPGGKSRSEEHTSELQSLMRISYAVFCLKKKKTRHTYRT